MVCVDGHRAKVQGRCDVCLYFSCGSRVILRYVLNVPTISKRLVSTDNFDKGGFKMELEKGKIMITKGKMYVGRENKCLGMYRLCLSDEGIAI